MKLGIAVGSFAGKGFQLQEEESETFPTPSPEIHSIKPAWCTSESAPVLRRMEHRTDPVSCRQSLSSPNSPETCACDWQLNEPVPVRLYVTTKVPPARSQQRFSPLIYKEEIQTTQVSGRLKTAPYRKEPVLSLCWFWISPLHSVFRCVTCSTLSGLQFALPRPICKCSDLLIFSLYAPHRKQLQR